MQSAWLLGGGAGLGAAILCMTGNLWRGDRHTLTTIPDLLTGLALVLLIGLGARRAMRWYPEDKRRAGIRAAGGAGLAFGLAMGVFAWWYFTSPSMAVSVAMAVGSALGNGLSGLVIGLLNVQAVTGPRLREVLGWQS